MKITKQQKEKEKEKQKRKKIKNSTHIFLSQKEVNRLVSLSPVLLWHTRVFESNAFANKIKQNLSLSLAIGKERTTESLFFFHFRHFSK